jgi:hypothetical protein
LSASQALSRKHARAAHLPTQQTPSHGPIVQTERRAPHELLHVSPPSSHQQTGCQRPPAGLLVPGQSTPLAAVPLVSGPRHASLAVCAVEQKDVVQKQVSVGCNNCATTDSLRPACHPSVHMVLGHVSCLLGPSTAWQGVVYTM